MRVSSSATLAGLWLIGLVEAQGCADDAAAVIAGLKSFGVLYHMA